MSFWTLETFFAFLRTTAAPFLRTTAGFWAFVAAFLRTTASFLRTTAGFWATVFAFLRTTAAAFLRTTAGFWATGGGLAGGGLAGGGGGLAGGGLAGGGGGLGGAGGAERGEGLGAGRPLSSSTSESAKDSKVETLSTVGKTAAWTATSSPVAATARDMLVHRSTINTVDETNRAFIISFCNSDLRYLLTFETRSHHSAFTTEPAWLHLLPRLRQRKRRESWAAPAAPRLLEQLSLLHVVDARGSCCCVCCGRGDVCVMCRTHVTHVTTTTTKMGCYADLLQL
jgi:hypothetical protein